MESKKNGRIEGWVHNTGHCSKNQWCVKGLYRRIFWARLKWPPLQVRDFPLSSAPRYSFVTKRKLSLNQKAHTYCSLVIC